MGLSSRRDGGVLAKVVEEHGAPRRNPSLNRRRLGGAMEGEEGVRLMEEASVLDFDMLCAAVALQTQGVKAERRMSKEEEEDDRGDAGLGGVQRMWEGSVFGCLEDRRIAVEAAW